MIRNKLIAGLLVGMAFAGVSGVASAAYDHTNIATLYAQDGANTCAGCHLDEVKDFKSSVHYSARSAVDNPNFFFPGGGKHGMLDRACALVGSNMLLNMLTGAVDAATAPSIGNIGQQCGKCHTNYWNTLFEGYLAMQPGMNETTASQAMLSGVDCLICHSETYGDGDASSDAGDMNIRKQYTNDPSGLNALFGTVGGKPQMIKQDRSPAALSGMKKTPSEEACLRCHDHGRSDYKRGELPDSSHDAHYASSIINGDGKNPCLFCHAGASHHKFNRGAMVNGDIFASDYPVNGANNDVSCEKCHNTAPHKNDRLNQHTKAVACETCHIPYTAGAESTVWTDGGFLGLVKGTDNMPVKLYSLKKADGSPKSQDELWEAYKTRPIYMQFSGLTSFLAQSIPLQNPNTGGNPKIYPFKTIMNPLPFDGRFFGVGITDPNQIPMATGKGYNVNRYSMFAAMFMFQDQYKALGFMDADFDFARFTQASDGMSVNSTVPPTDPKFGSYAAMAQMSQFPNMLFFDKYTFGYNWYQNLETVPTLTTWDSASPTGGYIPQLQEGKYRPLAAKDMKKAVSVGMTRLLDMMMMMGFDPNKYITKAQYEAMGLPSAEAAMKETYATFTDDQLITMSAPPGSEMQAMLKAMGYENWANYPAWSNGVTLGGHGVSKAGALSCNDCHSQGGVFDQKVEVPAYDASGNPQFHWEFYSKDLLTKAEAGVEVADVAKAGYVKYGANFSMKPGAFVTATQSATTLGITFGKNGNYLAVLTPTTKLVSNWEVLGYSKEKVGAITNTESTSPQKADFGEGSEGSGCFIKTLAQ